VYRRCLLRFAPPSTSSHRHARLPSCSPCGRARIPISSAGAHRTVSGGLCLFRLVRYPLSGAFSPLPWGGTPRPFGWVGLRLGARRTVVGLRRLTCRFPRGPARTVISPVVQLIKDCRFAADPQLGLMPSIDLGFLTLFSTALATAFRCRPCSITTGRLGLSLAQVAHSNTGHRSIIVVALRGRLPTIDATLFGL
jgi:hypothetical protein